MPSPYRSLTPYMGEYTRTPTLPSTPPPRGCRPPPSPRPSYQSCPPASPPIPSAPASLYPVSAPEVVCCCHLSMLHSPRLLLRSPCAWPRSPSPWQALHRFCPSPSWPLVVSWHAMGQLLMHVMMAERPVLLVRTRRLRGPAWMLAAVGAGPRCSVVVLVGLPCRIGLKASGRRAAASNEYNLYGVEMRWECQHSANSIDLGTSIWQGSAELPAR